MYIYLRHQTVYTAYWRLYCIKNEAILTQIPSYWGVLWLYRFEYLRTMCSAISVGPSGMVQTIAETVLETFVVVNKNGPVHQAVIFAGGIWTNYIDIEEKIMQVRFIIFLSTWGYNSLGDLTRQHEVWRKILLNTNGWYLTKACIHYSFQLNLLLRAYFIDTKLMIWSASKQYYVHIFSCFTVIRTWQNLPTGGHGRVVCMGNLEEFFLK